MKFSTITKSLAGAVIFLVFGGQQKVKEAEPSGYQGQGPSPIVPTVSKPIEKQWKGIWAFDDNTTFFSNDFDGARLNGAVKDSLDSYSILISAENSPINPSPWYGFKVWSSSPRDININFTYQNSRSRYYPKVSRDGINFQPLDTALFTPINSGDEEFGMNAVSEMISIKVAVNNEPLWITAQELYTSTLVKAWADTVAQKDYVNIGVLGKSKQGRDMPMLTIGNESSKKAMMIISRQHPPEVTGFLAMKSFIETISGDSEQAASFRDQIVTYVIPLMNPDGVDNGHWRHNFGGIDLNRDWQNFNQPETSNVKRFMDGKTNEGYEFVFGGDFHSTWDDIYYPLDTAITGDKGKIIFDWIERISTRLPQKATNISASNTIASTMVSRNYFYVNHGMPAIVFELGDNTPRDFLKEKGKVAAEELMTLLMN